MTDRFQHPIPDGYTPVFAGVVLPTDKEMCPATGRLIEPTPGIIGKNAKLYNVLRAVTPRVIPPPFAVGDRVHKPGGSYQATGTVLAVFQTRKGEWRVVFDFDNPPGLLHIFSAQQVEKV